MIFDVYQQQHPRKVGSHGPDAYWEANLVHVGQVSATESTAIREARKLPAFLGVSRMTFAAWPIVAAQT